MSNDLSPQSQDVLVAGGLITSPAWASWLDNINEVLTTATLLIGLVLGVIRLWLFIERRYRSTSER